MALRGIYKVILRDPGGTQVAAFDNYRNLKVTKLINNVSVCQLTLNERDPRTNLFEPNSIVEVLRKVPGYVPAAVPAERRKNNGWYTEWEGLHCDENIVVYENNNRQYTSYSVGYLDFLDRREVLWLSSTIASESKKVAIPAQTAMYEFVDENCGPSALSASGRLIDGVITGFSLAASAGAGPNWSGMRSFRNVLEVLQEIANYSEIDFDVVSTGPATWEFQTYPDQLGADRTTVGLDSTTGKNAAGKSPVIFSLSLENIEQLSYSNKQRGSANVVVTAGKGQYGARATGLYEDTTAITPTRINQREITRNANTQDDPAELNTLAEEWGISRQPIDDITFTPLQVPSTLYGVHYWWGDRVTVRYEDKDIEKHKRLLGITLNIDEKGERLQGWKFDDIPRR